MIGMSGIDEPRRLFYVDRLSKKTLQKCIIHIQLSDRAALGDYELHTVRTVVGLTTGLNVSL